MIADACPYCGAAKRYPSCAGMEYGCGSWAAENGAKVQSTECARFIRLRISQLRRMAHTAWLRAGHSLNANLRRKRSQYDRFAAACLAEIERLRGMG